LVAHQAAAQDPVAFRTHLLPVFHEHCVHCHGVEKQESGLRLDTAAGVLRGGNRGPVLKAGNSGESRLVQVLRAGGEIPRMPSDADPLPEDTIALVTRWIDAGAAILPEEHEPEPSRQSDHWAFQPIAHSTPPAVQHSTWIRNPIDAFVLARLEQEGFAPAGPAERATLLRRVSLDLTGLPPTPEETAAWLLDNRPDAYEQLVQRLLASPHYAERWARHWLDLARYADSNGYTIDGGRSIWKYRDWVIQALHADLPFDQFVIEQLAGDMLPGATIEQRIATGFHRNTLKNEEGGTDPEQFRIEAVVDRVATTASVFLGLTVGCARCHDHKYDPITQREFYQLFSIFNNADEPTLPVPTEHQAKEEPALAADIQQMEKRLADVDANAGTRQVAWETKLAALATDDPEREKLPAAVREILAVAAEQRTAEQQQALRLEYQKHDPERLPLANALEELRERHKQLKAAITNTLVMRERKEPRVTTIHIRGDFLRPGVEVTPGVPQVLPPASAASERMDRLDFARWLVADNHPLTARVTVNRIWQQYFGAGLVATENDFGLQGDAPTHPELLDWLARAFMEGDWSLKKLHRLIVTSATYRQSSAWRSDLADRDPANKWIGRQQRLRLEAEVIRDQALAAAGIMSLEVGGPSVYPPQPEGIYAFTQQKKYWRESQGNDRHRRTMYTYFWRSSPYPFLTTFDAPDANVACTRRVRSNTPLQALTLANDRGYIEAAQALARRVLTDSAAGADDATRLRYAWRACLVRNPLPPELAALSDVLAHERARHEKSDESAETAAEPSAAELASWSAVARVLLNLDEFVTRE
jgi:hypothetical protein